MDWLEATAGRSLLQIEFLGYGMKIRQPDTVGHVAALRQPAAGRAFLRVLLRRAVRAANLEVTCSCKARYAVW